MKNQSPKDDFLNKIEMLLSTKKISFYKENYHKNWLKVYIEEVYRAKELFVYLHFFEIFLRNKIATEFAKDFGDWLLNPKDNFLLNPYDQEKLDETKVRLVKSGKVLNSDNIISNLNLGFWTNLFHKSYHVCVWQKCFMTPRIFPYLKLREINLKKIQIDLEKIRKIRNRIFHFENLNEFDFDGSLQLVERFFYGVAGVKFEEFL